MLSPPRVGALQDVAEPSREDSTSYITSSPSRPHGVHEMSLLPSLPGGSSFTPPRSISLQICALMLSSPHLSTEGVSLGWIAGTTLGRIPFPAGGWKKGCVCVPSHGPPLLSPVPKKHRHSALGFISFNKHPLSAMPNALELAQESDGKEEAWGRGGQIPESPGHLR